MHPQMANVPLQGLDRCALTAGAIHEIPSQIGGLFRRHFTGPVVDLHGKEHSGKADQSTLANGGSELTYA